MSIWLATVAGNLLLGLLMLFRGHYLRYRVLFVSLILDVLSAPATHFVYITYGNTSVQYVQAYWLVRSIELLLCLAIIWESRFWPKIGVPYEAYTICLLIVFYQGFHGSDVYEVNEAMRTVKLMGLAWLTFAFSGLVQARPNRLS